VRRRIEKEKKPALEIPHDLINEQTVIAAVLVDKKIRDRFIDKIPSSYFVDKDHGLIWSAIQSMRRRNLNFDLQTLHHKTSGQVELSYLKDIVDQYPAPPSNMNYHINILKWDYIRADTVRGPLSDLLYSLQDPSTSPEKIRGLSTLIDKAFKAHVDRSFMSDHKQLASKHIGEMKKRQNISTYPFGISELDKFNDGTHRMIPGLAPKKTTLLTAVPGSGKSTLAAKIALEQARRGRKILYGAWEEGSEAILELITTMSLNWGRYDVSTVNLTNDDLKRFHNRMEQIGEYIRFFDPPFTHSRNSKYSNDEALDVLYSNIADSGCDVFIGDLWGRCIPDRRPEAELRALLRQQQIAQETGVHQILVCQQNLKQVEATESKRPTRSTIFGSSGYVEIADTIIGVHNPSFWKSIPNDSLELLVLKQRYGKWPMAIEFDWNPDKATLENGRDVEFHTNGGFHEGLDRLVKGRK
jgi:replicative DNA helicase